MSVLGKGETPKLVAASSFATPDGHVSACQPNNAQNQDGTTAKLTDEIAETVLSVLAEHSTDTNINSWDFPGDPSNPQNWPSWLRWTLISLVSAMTFMVILSSSMFAPGVPALMVEFYSTNSALGSFVVTTFVLAQLSRMLSVKLAMANTEGPQNKKRENYAQNLYKPEVSSQAISFTFYTSIGRVMGFRIPEGYADRALAQENDQYNRCNTALDAIRCYVHGASKSSSLKVVFYIHIELYPRSRFSN